MRYYVVVDAIDPGEGLYVLAEVVRDPGDDKDVSMAAALAGARANIASRTELERSVDGLRALRRWDNRDDSVFESESEMLSGATRMAGTVMLRAVADGERERPRVPGYLPKDPRRREVFLKSIGLREVTRALVQRTKARQIEVDELHAREGGGDSRRAETAVGDE